MPEPDATAKLEPSSGEGIEPSTSPQPVVGGTGFSHLIPPAEAAALSFLGLLALGGGLLLAVKLQYPGLGAGANTIDALSGVVILALAILRVPVHVGQLTFTVLPIGALIAVFFVVRWACNTVGQSMPPRRGVVVGGLFAVMALAAAAIFRFRFEPDAVYAGAFGSALLGFVWVSLFAALALSGARQPLLETARRRLAGERQRNPLLFEGIRAGGLMLVLISVLAAAAGLLWVIVSLLGGGGPRSLDGGDLIAAVVYVAAFAPNLVVTVAALSLGAPVDVGAGLTIHGKLRGDVQQWSMLSGGLDLSILLCLVPLVACGFAGFWARRNSRRPERPQVILAFAALSFASVLAVLGWLGEARLGAQLASARGFWLVAPRAWVVFVLALLWAGGAGYAGWALAARGTRS